MFDVVIIGAGVTGSFIARALSKYNLKVLVLDKNSDVGNETSMANSAIVHSGYDPEPHTKKGQLNAKGNRLYPQICKELDVDFKTIGSLTVALYEEDLEMLKFLEQRAKENEVPVQLLNKAEALAIEPGLNPNIFGALLAPTCGIINPFELTVALMENAMDNGVALSLQCEVTQITKTDSGYLIETTKENIETHIVINAAGVYGDRIHQMIGPKTFEIRPRKGQYFVLDRIADQVTQHVLFPCPSEKGKGVLVIPTTDNNLLIGPNSEYQEDKEDTKVTSLGLDFILENAKMLAKNIPMQFAIRSFAGLRATASTHDFIIEEIEKGQGFINVVGIESPGLASSPAIAEEVVGIVGTLIDLKQKDNYTPYRKPLIKFNQLTIEEKNAYIKSNPAFGKVICKCENITEAEVVDAIHRNCGALTVKGIKKRIRPGAGRCQGGFCQPLIVDIIAKELGISPLEVMYDSPDSPIVIGETKE